MIFFCFIFLCIKISLYQCWYISSSYVIIMNSMVCTYCVCKGKIIFKITWTRGYHISNNFKFYGYCMLVDNVSKDIVCKIFKIHGQESCHILKFMCR